jgi:TonB family protein
MSTLRLRLRVSTGPDGGILKMVGWSVAGHIAFTIIFIFLPRVLPHTPPPPLLMTASIVSASDLQPSGGPPAPRAATTGPTPEERAHEAEEAAKEVPKPVPPPKKEPEPPKPPDPAPAKKKAAEAIKPVKADPSTPPPPGAKKQEKEEAASPAPVAQPEQPAVSPAAPLQEGVGLGASGGDGSTGVPSITSNQFPFQYYRTILVANIRSRWNRPLTPGLREPLRCAVAFVISRGGQVSGVSLSVPSGFPPLDESAVRAVLDSNPLPPLPYQYTTSSVSAEIIFELTAD